MHPKVGWEYAAVWKVMNSTNLLQVFMWNCESICGTVNFPSGFILFGVYVCKVAS